MSLAAAETTGEEPIAGSIPLLGPPHKGEGTSVANLNAALPPESTPLISNDRPTFTGIIAGEEAMLE
jgi:hypothetical protein